MPRLLGRLLRFLSRIARRPPAARVKPPRPKRLRAAKPPYDLAKDASTDNQKYLM
jgi:hypothetical protein